MDLGLIIFTIVIFSMGFIFGWGGHGWLKRRVPYDGVINVTKTPEKTLYLLELNGDPEDLAKADEALFKISKHPTITTPSQGNHGL